MIGLYLKYCNFNGSYHKERIGHYRFDNPVWNKAEELDAGEGKMYLLKCHCGGNSWTDDAGDINQYSCECCGQFVTVSPYKGE